ncbi:cilia- and flagella-associated protein 99-like isoform X2 [Mercenaria mercenaria]|uniref:cilia- and flagella-associated protein 99-like isoform X2 n=1 Tax=Mercenaria mercenaria TaxID=6596 RepID=UPI00234E6322|nr:cilia- and flagella-associated protein 99-like isoform X2 [Mercenaria mercenaria]
MNHKSLLEISVAVLDTYDKNIQSVDEHVNRCLKGYQIYDEDEQTFIVEVFSGCVRYAEVLNVVMRGYYAKDGKSVLRSEQNLYAVLVYLALFRLDELGMANYRQFVKSQDINRTHKFLNFFFNEKSITGWMKDEWQKYYEHVFVQTKLVSPLRRWLPELKEMVSQMKEKIDNVTKPRRKALTSTEIKPFNITQPRPKSVPVPEPIPKLQKHKPPPDTLYKLPTELTKIEKVKQDNRRKAEERLMEASRKQFACANPEKSQKTKEKIHNILTEEENKLDFDRPKTNKAPSFLNQEVPVKMTAAAILREGALYQKREAEEIRRLENLEAGAKDKSEFEKWQNEMKRKDLEAELSDIERRRLEGKLSHEEAILARQNIIQENKQRVAEIKEETQKMMERFLEEKFREEQQMRQLVEETMKGHKNAKESQKKLQEYKQKIVQEVAEESQELMRRAIEEAEIEMRRRMELIHQIRAMEAVPVIRQKFVDLTSAAGHGLLSEMSIAELKERVALLKNAEREAEENKRDEILADKEAKDQLLLDTLEKISKHRLEQTKAAAIKLESRKKGEPKKMQVQNEELSALQKRLEEKRQQRVRTQETSRLVPNTKSAQRTKSLITQKKHLEESRWKELEATRERTAQVMQQSYAKSASRLNTMMSVT